MPDLWMRNQIADGIGRLYRLRLKFGPGADAIQQTIDGWTEVVEMGMGLANQQLDSHRIAYAFAHLMKTSKEWPSPASLLEHLPPRKIKALPNPEMSDEERARGVENIRRINKIIAGIG